MANVPGPALSLQIVRDLSSLNDAWLCKAQKAEPYITYPVSPDSDGALFFQYQPTSEAGGEHLFLVASCQVEQHKVMVPVVELLDQLEKVNALAAAISGHIQSTYRRFIADAGYLATCSKLQRKPIAEMGGIWNVHFEIEKVEEDYYSFEILVPALDLTVEDEDDQGSYLGFTISGVTLEQLKDGEQCFQFLLTALPTVARNI